MKTRYSKPNTLRANRIIKGIKAVAGIVIATSVTMGKPIVGIITGAVAAIGIEVITMFSDKNDPGSVV